MIRPGLAVSRRTNVGVHDFEKDRAFGKARKSERERRGGRCLRAPGPVDNGINKVTYAGLSPNQVPRAHAAAYVDLIGRLSCLHRPDDHGSLGVSKSWRGKWPAGTRAEKNRRHNGKRRHRGEPVAEAKGLSCFFLPVQLSRPDLEPFY